MSLSRGERAKLNFLRKRMASAKKRFATAVLSRDKKVEDAQLPVAQIEQEMNQLEAEIAPLAAKDATEPPCLTPAEPPSHERAWPSSEPPQGVLDPAEKEVSVP